LKLKKKNSRKAGCSEVENGFINLEQLVKSKGAEIKLISSSSEYKIWEPPFESFSAGPG
jgi:hypothetical protein